MACFKFSRQCCSLQNPPVFPPDELGQSQVAKGLCPQHSRSQSPDPALPTMQGHLVGFFKSQEPDRGPPSGCLFGTGARPPAETDAPLSATLSTPHRCHADRVPAKSLQTKTTPGFWHCIPILKTAEGSSQFSRSLAKVSRMNCKVRWYKKASFLFGLQMFRWLTSTGITSPMPKSADSTGTMCSLIMLPM